MYIGYTYCTMWTDACNNVDDIIFVYVLVPLNSPSPLPGLPNGHCALYLLGFVVAAGCALRPLTISHLTPSIVDYYLPSLYVCLCSINILCRYPLSLQGTFSLRALIQPTSLKEGALRLSLMLRLVSESNAQRFTANSIRT